MSPYDVNLLIVVPAAKNVLASPGLTARAWSYQHWPPLSSNPQRKVFAPETAVQVDPPSADRKTPRTPPPLVWLSSSVMAYTRVPSPETATSVRPETVFTGAESTRG